MVTEIFETLTIILIKEKDTHHFFLQKKIKILWNTTCAHITEILIALQQAKTYVPINAVLTRSKIEETYVLLYILHVPILLKDWLLCSKPKHMYLLMQCWQDPKYEKTYVYIYIYHLRIGSYICSYNKMCTWMCWIWNTQNTNMMVRMCLFSCLYEVIIF